MEELVEFGTANMQTGHEQVPETAYLMFQPVDGSARFGTEPGERECAE
jgi:hypothetical protein